MLIAFLDVTPVVANVICDFTKLIIRNVFLGESMFPEDFHGALI